MCLLCTFGHVKHKGIASVYLIILTDGLYKMK